MKKQNKFALLSITLLLLFITNNAESTSVSTGAAGTIKCIKSTISSCGIATTPSDYASTWSIRCDDAVSISGLAVCAAEAGVDTIGDTGQVVANTWYDGSDVNDVCWCRIIMPFVSKWTFGGIPGSNPCAMDCAKMCAQEMEDSSNFRTNIYSVKGE